MHLVVGLGNPGREYQHSRHNLGFEVVDTLAERHKLAKFRTWHNALAAKGQIAGTDVLLAKPQTYMNLSGDAVSALVQFYRLEPANIIVIHDELDFSPGQVRIKQGGGDGGNHGVQSIIGHIGRDFVRVRLGIGKPESANRGADHVLSRFDGSTQKLVNEAIATAADGVEAILAQGVTAAMNRFNRRSDPEPDPKDVEK